MTKYLKHIILFTLLCIVLGKFSGYAQTKTNSQAISFFKTYIDSLTYDILLNDAISEQLLAKNSSEQIRKIYSHHNYCILWPNEKANLALQILENSRYHGLNPDDYNVGKLHKTKTFERTNYTAKALFDIQLTEQLLAFAKTLSCGKLNPEEFYFSWNFIKPTNFDIDSAFIAMIDSNNLVGFENIFAPLNSQYRELRIELQKRYHSKTQNYSEAYLSYPGKVLRKGDRNQYVKALKQKLFSTGFLQKADVNMVFDQSLEMAIIKLQQTHGLTADGLPGRNTYKVLNWTDQKYIDVLRVNMERWRWMPKKSDELYIEVNIPEYELRVFNQDSIYYETKVIVGKYKHQTPVFQSKLDYLVFNPCWTVPNSIAIKSILPRLKTDSTYLDKRNMFVCINGVKQNHAQIDFTQYSSNNFPYKIFQNTDPGNALGKVKFMFENKYSIYLHDTPGKSSFFKDNRALSHGCIRVQNALQFANVILYQLDEHKIEMKQYLAKGYPEKVYLQKQIPLNITYFTCMYNPKLNQVQFFNDVYVSDYKVLKALSE